MGDLFYNVQFTQCGTNLGSLRDLIQDGSTIDDTTTAIINSASAVTGFKTVTGVTDSRLDEVRTYNNQQPYIVGVNGVTTVTATEIVYVIDGVTFATGLTDGVTTYSLGLVPPGQALGNYFLYRNERDVFIDKHPTVRDILMLRSEMSVFDPMLRIATVNSLDDLEDYFKA